MSTGTDASGHPGLEEATIAELAAGMESGALTAHSLVEAYLHRIQTLDQSGPALNAIIEPTLIRLAFAFEQATQHRQPPQYLPTADQTETG